MSYSYSNNPAGSNVDLLRMLLHDTSSGTAKFSDEDLQWFVDNSANVWYAAAEAADTLAARITASGASKSVGELRIDYGGSAQHYENLAARWRSRGSRGAVPFAGGIFSADKDTENADTARSTPAFRVGQFDYAGSTY